MIQSKYYILLLLLSVGLTFQSCSRKADGDEEMKVMIVGTWKARVSGSSLTQKQKFHIMEFTSDGRYRDLKYFGTDEDWNSADPTGFLGYDVFSSFEDSLIYEIQDNTIYFERMNNNQNAFIKKIVWIKPNDLKIEHANENTYKYEKI